MIDRDHHATYWRKRIAGMSDAELSKWIDGIADAKFKAKLVADPDTLTISKVDGEWPEWVYQFHKEFTEGVLSKVLDALLEGPK